MKKIILGLALIVIPSVAAYAATPLTFEQAQVIALAKVPGTILETERSIHNGAVVFEFEIEQPNGRVMEIEIDSATGKILELKVERMQQGENMPSARVSALKAQEAAIYYIENRVSGLRPVEVIDNEYTIVNDHFVYVVECRRGIKTFEVLVDANTGDVMSMKEDD